MRVSTWLGALFALLVACLGRTSGQDGKAVTGDVVLEKFSNASTHVHLIYFYSAAEPRRLCALESTLRTNPNAYVHIYTASERAFIESYSQTPLVALYPSRVVVHETSFDELFRGTPLEEWYRNETVRKTGQQLANAGRLVILQKYGGTYMDLDFMVKRDLAELPRNFLALQSKSSLAKVDRLFGHTINSAFLRFEPNHPFVNKALKMFVEGYKAFEWGKNGPHLMTRVYKNKCGMEGDLSAWCANVTLAGFQTVYPFPWQLTKHMLTNATELIPAKHIERINDAHAVHLWNHVWSKTKLQPRSAMAKILAEGCPIAFTCMAFPKGVKHSPARTVARIASSQH